MKGFNISLILLLTLTACAGPNLFSAVIKEDAQEVTKLVGHGENLNKLDWRGRSPLIFAAKTGNIVIGKYLIKMAQISIIGCQTERRLLAKRFTGIILRFANNYWTAGQALIALKKIVLF